MPAMLRDTFVLPTRLASIDDARQWASGHARSAHVGDEAVAAVELALTEALANVIQHSYEDAVDEEILLALEIDDEKLEIDIHDRGKPFDRDSYRPPDLDNPAAGGYGIYLMEELMDEVIRRPLDDGGTLVLLIRYRRERP